MAQSISRPARARLATAMMTVCGVVAAGCGGTLEGKYRRGQITTSTTAGSPAPGTAPTTPTSITTVPTSGNAADPDRRGEPEGAPPGGTIEGSAARRADAPPSGGRHR